jgi:hypothetical protein
VRDAEKLIRDPDGSHFPNLAAVRLEAIENAREIMSQDLLCSGNIRAARSFEIADATGRILLIVPFRDAVEL